MVIAFEGMDGVGKSSISQRVSEELDIRHESQKVLRLLGGTEEMYRKFVKTIRTDDNKRLALMFYTFKSMLDQAGKEDSIVERTMLSVYFYEHSKVSEEEFNYLMSLGCIPELIFILYASSDERKKRIISRDALDEDLNSSEALSDGYKDMLECAHKYNIPYIGINTEKYSEDEVEEICSSIIRRAKNMNNDERLDFIYEMNDEYGFDDLYKERRLLLNER